MVAWGKEHSIVFPTPHIRHTSDAEQGRAHPPDYLWSAVVWAKAAMATSIIAAMISATASTNKTRFTTSYLLAFCGSRLRHWLHSPQKVPNCGTGFSASTFFP